ncbi:hypothetical protein FRB99_008857 [Tulasnella sp. 403]|nr:hypothetical protein FRB99_008857 [Tulasnella sp. 403]
MATSHRSFGDDLEDLYNQIQSGFTTDTPNLNLNQGYGLHSQDPRNGHDDSRSQPRPLPTPFSTSPSQEARPRPLPQVPQPSVPDIRTAQYTSPINTQNITSPIRSPNQDLPTTPQQGIKRLPAVPLPTSPYPNYGASMSPQTAYPDGRRSDGYEKGRGAALYASALPPSRRPQPQPPVPQGGVPVIDVAPANSSQSQQSYDNRRPDNGVTDTTLTRQDSRSRMPYTGSSPLIPPAGASYSSYDTGSSGLNGSYVPPVRSSSYSVRTQSTNTLSQSQNGAGRLYDSISQSPQHLAPNGANGTFHSGDDHERDNIGSALLRSSSATSSISGSSYQPLMPGQAERASLSPSLGSQADSLVSSARYGQTIYAQTTTNSTITHHTGPAFEYIPPTGSDVKVSFESHHSDGKSGFYQPEDDQELSRRLQEDQLLNERISDLKQRLGKLEIHDGDQQEYAPPDDIDDYYDEEDEEDDSRFINLALLSHIAVRLRDKVPRATHVKGSIPYPRAFTGKDVVSTIQSIIQRELLISLGISTNDRRIALQVARSLQDQLYIYEVEWGGRSLSDSVEDVFMFLDDDGGEGEAGPSNAALQGLAELPTGVITLLTKCYSPSCGEGEECYSYSCPKRGQQISPSLITQPAVSAEPERNSLARGWKQTVPQEVIDSIGEREVRRQNIIFKMIEKEEQYVQDLDFIDVGFIKALHNANPPIVPPNELDSFIDDIFGNIMDLRETNKRLLENMYVRQREQKPVIQRIGDVFLTAAAEFRWAYPMYVGHLPLAEKRLKEELENNSEFRLFLEQVARSPEARRLDLKHFISRPSDHLRNYPVLLEAALKETDAENPDIDYLGAAAQAIRNLLTVAQLRTFQSGMARNPNGIKEWHQLVGKEVMEALPKQDAKRQSIMFELIYGEMEYVRDLETIETLYIRPLQEAVPPIIPKDRVNNFIREVFWNVKEVLSHHRKLVDRLHEIQREEHPQIRTITAPIFDAALNWRDAYMEYIPHYPIAAFRIAEELANNQAFKTWHDATVKHPDSRKQDMKAFVFRPIPRLLRYDLLLKAIRETLPAGHEDVEAIPQALDIIKDLGKATEPGVHTAEKKVELWNYHANLVFKPGDAVDMDLLADTRALVHTGRLLRQPDSNLDISGWSELFVILFDNYLVMTKPKEKDGVTKYYANKRPIPLELLSLVGFTEVPQHRSVGIFRGLRREGGGGGANERNDANAQNGGSGSDDSKTVWPCSIHHTGRVGGLYQLFAESAQIRAEWKQKLEEAIAMRTIVQESNKVFEIRNLSENTFVVPSIMGSTAPGRTPQKLNGTKDVQFFSVGTLNGRTLIIYMKKKGLDSVFRVLEPVIGKITEKAKNPGTFGRSFFGGSRSEWFRVYRDFFLPSESFDLVFLKAKIAILCTKGFEIMDLTNFNSVTIPQKDDPRLSGLAKRLESCRPMGMFRSNENEFLLCYDEFGLYVDRHGDPNRASGGIIEWEGTAERVAFHPPYVVIFDSRFIEIRNIEKGQLVQIIRGTDIRCLWDGRSAALPPATMQGGVPWDESSRIHAVMKSPDAQPSGKVVVQHVFELVPTVPLFASQPLHSPAPGGFFPQAGSPPHSPGVGMMQVWR